MHFIILIKIQNILMNLSYFIAELLNFQFFLLQFIFHELLKLSNFLFYYHFCVEPFQFFIFLFIYFYRVLHLYTYLHTLYLSLLKLFYKRIKHKLSFIIFNQNFLDVLSLFWFFYLNLKIRIRMLRIYLNLPFLVNKRIIF